MYALVLGLAVALSSAPVWARSQIRPSAPGTPSGVTAVATSPSSVHLTWNDNTVGEDGFRIERSTDGARYSEVGETGANVTEFDDTGVPDNTRYYYRVMAFDRTGATQPSTPASVTTPQGFWSVAGRVVEGNDFNPVVGATVTVTRGVSAQTPKYEPGVEIPDNNVNGVVEAFEIPTNVTIEGLQFALKITHELPGEVKVRLVHPDGTGVLLHDRGRGVGSGGIETVYPTQTTPVQSLSAFTGKSTAGQWRLEVSDVVGGDVGRLESFQMTVTGPAASLTATTDQNGYYSFAEIPSGKISVSASAPNLSFTDRELDLRGDTVRVNFISDLH